MGCSAARPPIWRTAFAINGRPGQLPRSRKAAINSCPRHAAGFKLTDRVDLLVRSADSSEWTRVTMTADSSGRYNYRLFDLAKVTEYSVEASGVRSAVYKLDVADLAYVKRLDLEYRYPAYTQLPNQHVDSTGDIAALKGTIVRVRVTPTRPTNGGRVIVQGGDTLQLSRTADGALIAMVRVEKEGFYKVELQGPDGRMVTGSLDYTIDALPDRPPTVSFTKPGRDTKVLSVDEVFTQARATDDYGVAKLELVYSVNGAPEKTIPLYTSSGKVMREVSAGHTFMLEDEHLVAGDVVSYFARATDNNAVSGAQTVRTTDIYFLQVRLGPTGRIIASSRVVVAVGEAVVAAPTIPGPLSSSQRQVVAADVHVYRARQRKARQKIARKKISRRCGFPRQKLREEIEALGKRLVDRGIAASDSNWKEMPDGAAESLLKMDKRGKSAREGSAARCRRGQGTARARAAAARRGGVPRHPGLGGRRRWRRRRSRRRVRGWNLADHLLSSEDQDAQSSTGPAAQARINRPCMTRPPRKSTRRSTRLGASLRSASSARKTNACAARQTACARPARAVRRMATASAISRTKRNKRRASSSGSHVRSSRSKWPMRRGNFRTPRTR